MRLQVIFSELYMFLELHMGTFYIQNYSKSIEFQYIQDQATLCDKGSNNAMYSKEHYLVKYSCPGFQEVLNSH